MALRPSAALCCALHTKNNTFPFSTRTGGPKDAPFLEELQAPEKTNPNYKLIASMTKMEESHRPWHGETGLIDKEMVATHLKGVARPIYYIAGPPEMVKGLQTMIHETGVADADIRAEEFVGY